MTTHAHLSRPMHPMTSRIPKSTLDAAREVVRHCFESASISGRPPPAGSCVLRVTEVASVRIGE